MSNIEKLPAHEREVAALHAWDSLDVNRRMFLIEGMRRQFFTSTHNKKYKLKTEREKLASKKFSEIRRQHLWLWFMCCNGVDLSTQSFPDSFFARSRELTPV